MCNIMRIIIFRILSKNLLNLFLRFFNGASGVFNGVNDFSDLNVIFNGINDF